MGKVYNRETGRLFALLLLLFLAALCVGNVANGMVVRKQREAHQQFFAAFFGNVKAMYPEVREEEWIGLLNGAEHVEAGRELLRGYGILEGHETFELQEKYIRETCRWMDGCLFLLFLMLSGCVFRFLRRRQRRLDRLAEYLQNVAQGDYMLEIESQWDDELSSLQNELYKVVVLLREQAGRLKEQKKALADSVADISHQLKTPLTSVMVLVDNLSESVHMEEATRKHFLEEITAQLSGMAWLVAAMLKLSRLDAGVVELERRELSALQLLRSVADGLEQQAEWRGVSVKVEAEEDAQLCGDAKWLKEALTNIVKNGMEHSMEEGEVVLALQDNSVYTEISVQNFGEILTEEDQKHIFERFYQRRIRRTGRNAAAEDGGRAETSQNAATGDGARASQKVENGEEQRIEAARAGMENAGIGLALAKEIIERQDGYITVESTEERGTIFTIKFMKCH